MNFIHTADLHLGYRQYDLDERLRDFGRAFMEIARYSIEHKAGFMLIAGDLFNSRNINAPTYYQAHHILSLLREAGIPCVAIEGNHDHAYIKDGMSWLEALESQGLLRLIRPGPAGELMKNYVDIDGARIFGLRYAGASTSRVIPDMAREIAAINAVNPPRYTILMMHTGIEGQAIGHIIGETTYEDISKLKGVVDYLALGHYHNAYTLDGWLYNPGSPETCSIAECCVQKSFYHVTDGEVTVKPLDCRPFRTILVPVDGHLSATSLLNELESRLAAIDKTETQPVVNVIFRGCLSFDKSHIDLESVKATVTERMNTLYLDVRFDMTNDEFGITGLETGNFDRLAIEREVLGRFAQADSMLSEYSDYYASTLSDIKDLAIKEADPEMLDESLRDAYDRIKNKTAPHSVRKTVEPLPVIPAPVIRTVEPEIAAPVAAPKKPVKRKSARVREELPEAPAPQGKTLNEFWRK